MGTCGCVFRFLTQSTSHNSDVLLSHINQPWWLPQVLTICVIRPGHYLFHPGVVGKLAYMPQLLYTVYTQGDMIIPSCTFGYVFHLFYQGTPVYLCYFLRIFCWDPESGKMVTFSQIGVPTYT